LRRAGGSERAAQELGTTREVIRDVAPGFSQHPLLAEEAALDAEYRRLIDEGDEAARARILSKGSRR
jgi:hypothetical protein